VVAAEPPQGGPPFPPWPGRRGWCRRHGPISRSRIPKGWGRSE
jgi:hypothetical protein